MGMLTVRKKVKIIGFSVPIEVAEEVDELARHERRTKTEVFQAMLRLYQQERRKQENTFDHRIEAAIAEATLKDRVQKGT